MNLYPHLARSAEEAARIARTIKPEQLTAPTPCAEFDARTLINHWVLYTSHGLEHRALRTTLPEELTEHDFTADPAWAEAYAAQLDRALAAWARPEAWEGGIDMGGAEMPAADIAAMLLLEMVLHGWDVAKAVGQEFRTDEETSAVVLAAVAAQAEMFRQYKGFAEPVEIAATATDFERALALSGRDPDWSA
ncbi:TIGR03086 family metal-binding protein [Streptomyces sp. H10-C2]|uniref:TIGR03086 family metal-binding protein n=1 Tax=unclassified Streptomyces TaxID=2593676 RepID=UPI0024BA5FD7|nr:MULTISPECIES: TIGR03086 family metal-binding protein [unclassified Streptomyces]MDJ0344597.1 TIGR03086 family metal-binding protein [Streptomyces sp. PH10-H1]MDJ0370994.1 TIGR03086 family metal-binding protein [Streptomyces sp. H10-C2]